MSSQVAATDPTGALEIREQMIRGFYGEDELIKTFLRLRQIAEGEEAT